MATICNDSVETPEGLFFAMTKDRAFLFPKGTTSFMPKKFSELSKRSIVIDWRTTDRETLKRGHAAAVKALIAIGPERMWLMQLLC